MRINKFLAQAGVGSRRACDKIIEDNRVTINGKLAKLGDEVGEADIVTLDGKNLSLKTDYVYYIMNKPKGYICSVADEKGRKTVMELLPEGSERVYPVGRLDYDTEGLLILTNDGDLAFRLTHPSNEVPKTYSVKVEGIMTLPQLNKLRTGVELDGVMTRKASVKITETNKEYTKLSITIKEGKNRQVRRMFEAVGKNVTFLKRVKVGELTLRGVDRGSVRHLTADEVYYLKNF